MAEINCTEVVIRFQNGDEAAFGELYEKMYLSMYYQARSIVKNETLAEDIVQDAFLIVHDKIHSLESPTAFAPWLTSIVRNQALGELRKQKRFVFSETEEEQNTLIFTEEDVEKIDPSTVPELDLDKKETKRLLQYIIGELTEAQQLCISLYYMNELSLKEIAEEIGIKENTVKSRLFEARKRIKEAVLDLEKKGTRLYSVSPLAFFLLLVRKDQEAILTETVKISTVRHMNQLLRKVGKKPIRYNPIRPSRILSSIKAAKTITAVKAIAAVTAVTVGTGTTYVVLHQDQRSEEDSQTEVIEMEMQTEESESSLIEILESEVSVPEKVESSIENKEKKPKKKKRRKKAEETSAPESEDSHEAGSEPEDSTIKEEDNSSGSEETSESEEESSEESQEESTEETSEKSSDESSEPEYNEETVGEGSLGDNTTYAWTKDNYGDFHLRISGSGAIDSSRISECSEYCDGSIIEIEIGEGVTVIPDRFYSFRGTWNEIYLPQSVERIESGAFESMEITIHLYRSTILEVGAADNCFLEYID